MTGIPGSGKSVFAEKFSSTFGAPIVSDTPFWSPGGESTPELRQAVLNYQLDQLLLTKSPVIIDSHTATAKQRSQLLARAKKHGYTPLVIWVQTDPASAEQRSVRRRQAGKRRYTLEEFEAERQQFEAPAKKEPLVVISGKHTYASQAKVVLGVLASDRPKEQRINTTAPRIKIR